MGDVTVPNFFIVGAPKSGTTALSVFLSEHPQIFFSDPKEPEYFAKDLKKPQNWLCGNDFDEYQKLFESANEKHLVVGEGSVMYMFSKTAIREIYNFNPEAKLIIIVRNPLDLAYSFHEHLRFDFEEDQGDFAKAWALQEKRKKGLNLPKNIRNPSYLQYGEVAMLGNQVEKVFNIFPSNQIKIIVYDDFIKSNRKEYLKVLKFLGVQDDNRKEFNRYNERLNHKWRGLSVFRRKLPKGMQNFIRVLNENLTKLPYGERFGFTNRTKINRKPLPQSLKREMSDFFRDDVKKLSKIIKRDLNYWLCD
ncbi:MAG TPA: sulfotransferase [Thermotogaceae bacterium]|nr:MAG: hypothetical protein DRJ02_08170 [Bacteroidota bacterium]HEW92137.1 sulfotransferase [Thermotogaceae bacterium]